LKILESDKSVPFNLNENSEFKSRHGLPLLTTYATGMKEEGERKKASQLFLLKKVVPKSVTNPDNDVKRKTFKIK